MEPRNSTGVSRPMGPMPGRLGNPHGNGRDLGGMGGMGGQLQMRTSMAGGGFERGGGQQHMEAAPPTGANTGTGGGDGAAAGQAAGTGGVDGALKQLSQANEKAWGTLGSVSRSMENDAQALESFERALAHNPYSPSALAGLGGVHKARGDYRKVSVLGALLRVSHGYRSPRNEKLNTTASTQLPANDSS